MIRVSFSALALLALLLTFSACNNGDPCENGDCPSNEQEVITTVRLTFSKGGNATTFVWKDADGDGGNAPVIDTIWLDSASTFAVGIEVLDESKTPVDNITTEIFAEGAAHQFFYRFTAADSSLATLAVAYNDADANSKPIGLAGIGTTGSKGTGSLRVTLLHEPDKSAPGVAAGDPTVAGGEADIDIVFPVIVK